MKKKNKLILIWTALIWVNVLYMSPTTPVCAATLNDAVAVWRFVDRNDDPNTGSMNSNWNQGAAGNSYNNNTGDLPAYAAIAAINSDNRVGLDVAVAGFEFINSKNYDVSELLPAGNVTIFARVNFAAFNGVDDIVSVHREVTFIEDVDHIYGLEFSDGTPRFEVHGDEAPDRTNEALYLDQKLLTGTWYDVTGVFDGGAVGDNSGTMTLYVYNPQNGELVAKKSRQVDFDTLETEPGVGVGGHIEVLWFESPNESNANFEPHGFNDGAIDMAAVWMTALTQREIAALSSIYDVNSGKIVHLKFDEGAGSTAADSSDNGYDGVLVGHIGWSKRGKYGSCLQCSGGKATENYLELKKSRNILFRDANCTVVMWIKTSSTVQQPLFCKTGADGIFNSAAVVLGITRQDDPAYFGKAAVNMGRLESQDFSASLNDGKWRHVAVVMTNEAPLSQWSWELYIDGVKEPQQWRVNSDQSSLVQGDMVVRLAGGCNFGWFSNAFDGLIDELHIFNRALTVGEIQTLMHGDRR